ncbi:MAG: hypothetical protein ACR2MF_09525 [Chthoniobacterales bacterium]
MPERPSIDWRMAIRRTALALACILAWLVLLDFSKKSLVAGLESSWMAALTYATANGLQFGRDITFTYGPLAHLVFSTFSLRLFAPDFAFEILLKGIFIAIVGTLSVRLPPARRWWFLVTTFAVAVIDYQTLYLLALAGLGCLLLQPRRTYSVAIAAGLFFAAIAALIKFTFLWFAILLLVLVSANALAERRFLRAAAPPLVFGVVFCFAWRIAGQQFATLGDFFRTGWQVTSGYSQTMGLSPTPGALAAGLNVAALLAVQLLLLVGLRGTRRTWVGAAMFAAAAFLSWKLGFVRADAHTTHFFYFAIATATAAPIILEQEQSKARRRTEWSVLIAIVGTSGAALFSEVPTIHSTFTDLVRNRFTSNLAALRHPGAEAARWNAAYREDAGRLALPRIKSAVGSARVDVFGYEQAVAIANDLHYTPNPTVQSYGSYTPALSELTAAFYRSENSPDFVIFTLEPIDNRLPTLDDAEVLVRLLQDFDPILTEKGYLLLKRQRHSRARLRAELRTISEGSAKIGEPIPIPPGMIWCELEMRSRFLGRVVNFFYHSPEAAVQLSTADGRMLECRLLPSLAGAGFLVNPLPRSESEFVEIAAGHVTPGIITSSLRVLTSTLLQRTFKPLIKWRFAEIPPRAMPSTATAQLYKELRGFADVLSQPAASVNSSMPVQRFTVGEHRFLLVHPVGEVRFEVPRGASAVSGEFAIQPAAYTSGAVEGVTFQIDYVASEATDQSRTLFRKLLQPRRYAADQNIQQFQIQLPSGAPGELILRTLPPPSGSIDWAWAGWSNIHFQPTELDTQSSGESPKP